MSAWRYLTADELIEHGEQLKIGPAGLQRARSLHGRARADLRWERPLPRDSGQGLPSSASTSRYHPFVDGNKRAAAIAMLTTCYLSSFVPVMTQEELVAVIMLIVEGQMSRDELAGFLRDRMT